MRPDRYRPAPAPGFRLFRHLWTARWAGSRCSGQTALHDSTTARRCTDCDRSPPTCPTTAGNSRQVSSRRMVLPAVWLPAVWLLMVTGCGPAEIRPVPAPTTEYVPLFQDVTQEVGLTVSQTAVPRDDFPMPQIMGSGCALLDANQDGRLDILVVPGELPPSAPAATAAATPDRAQQNCPFFLQQADGSFLDQTAEAGLQLSAHGMGTVVGDVDNDGDLDVGITTTSGLQLFLNDGAARFRNVTAAAGVATTRWATAAALTDFDRDGWLDLLVVNYVDYFPGSICQDGTGRRDYCGPLSFAGTVDRLYRNLGGAGQPAVFQDVTVSSGLAEAVGKGLGAICSDLNGDGLVDLYIANDMEPNRLWIQQADGRFQEEAELRGCSVDLQGKPQASMGTVWQDLNADGLHDIFLTHLRGETNTFYQQLNSGIFLDQSGASGLGSASLDFTGFGVAAPDLNLDGRADMVIANGRVMRAPLLQPEPGASHWEEYAERNQIFLNSGEGQFTEVVAPQEPFLQPVEVSRGLAVGDVDNDGDSDVLVCSTSAPVRLFRNVAPREGHWLTLRVMDPAGHRDAIGARVTVHCGPRQWTQEVQPNVGYLSSHDLRLQFGLGPVQSVDAIDVVWPDGARDAERFPGGAVDRQLELRRGSGNLLTPGSPAPSSSAAGTAAPDAAAGPVQEPAAQ